MRTKPAVQHDLLGATLLQVRSGRAISRTSLASTLGLAASTAGLYVDELIRDGYLAEIGLERGRVGRPQRTLTTVARAGWFAGVEFNAERVQVVRVDFSGALVASKVKRLAPNQDAAGVLDAMNAALAVLADKGTAPLLAVGVGAPGVVDPVSGESSAYAFIPGWDRVPVAGAIRKRFEVPVTVENNLRTIALAERWFGGGRNLDDYVILGPRSGFGVAVVQGGKLLRGAHHGAGEIGHWLWGATGNTTPVLQDMLSATAVWRRLARAEERARLPDDLSSAIGAFSGASNSAWEGVVADYARVVGGLQLLLDTDVFFLHGPLTALGARFCGAVEEGVRSVFPMLVHGAFKVIPSSLGDNAGALGAASLAMERWVPVDPQSFQS